MRVLTFAPYQRDDEDVGSAMAFLMLLAALLQFAPGDKPKRARRLEELLDDFDGIKIETEVEACDACGRQASKTLSMAEHGAQFAWEDEKFELLQEAWRAHRKNVIGMGIRARNRAEDLLESVERHTEEEWKKTIEEDAAAAIAASAEIAAAAAAGE